MKRNEICLNCCHFEMTLKTSPGSDSSSGFCKLNAPAISSDRKTAIWPLVSKEEWCGQFEV